MMQFCWFLGYESLAELEKMYQIAINGVDEERAAAASILCGASLARSWNVQVYTVSWIKVEFMVFAYITRPMVNP
jgi:hypothetical protein